MTNIPEEVWAEAREKAQEAAHRFVAYYRATDWKWSEHGIEYVPRASDIMRVLCGMLDDLRKKLESGEADLRRDEIVQSFNTGGLHVQAEAGDTTADIVFMFSDSVDSYGALPLEPQP